MGKLRPIGSEKLQGMDKLNRMIEISRYKENIPTPINEDTSVEYKKILADGNLYRIDKERNGYVIKKGINESSMEYLEPMKNRKYYSSYSQAFKRLNLITKEVNSLVGNDRNVSLFTESDDDVKYFLKTSMDEQAPPAAAPAPAPAPAPVPATAPAPEGMDDVEDTDVPDEMGAPAPGEEDVPETDEEQVTFKTVQKLTGKLAQKIRTLAADEENPMSSKDIKYVINSVLSAFDLNLLDEEDRDEIMGKFEGEEMGGEEIGGEEMGMEDMGGEEGVAPEAPEAPTGEMMEGDDSDYMDYGDFRLYEPERKGPKKLKGHGMKDEEAVKVEEMIEGLFSESKVDKILEKYFKVEQKEKILTEEKKEKRGELIWKVGKLSENIEQEVLSRKLINKYKDAKLLGKNGKKDLVFEVNQTKVRVTPNGRIL